MTLEQAAMVLLDPDSPAATWTEAARVANEARGGWSWPEPIPTTSRGREVFICSLCGLDLDEDEQDDGASAHDVCRLDNALKTIEAWRPVARAAVDFEAQWARLVPHAPQSDELVTLLAAVRALPAAKT